MSTLEKVTARLLGDAVVISDTPNSLGLGGTITTKFPNAHGYFGYMYRGAGDRQPTIDTALQDAQRFIDACGGRILDETK